MSVQAFYRLSLGLPLVIPVTGLLAIAAFGRPEAGWVLKVYQVFAMSLAYGGIPYLVAATAAAIWIDHRPEAEIRRLAVYAPFWVIAAWIPLIAYIAIRAASLEMFLGLLALGGGAIVVMGYVYVAIVFVLRAVLGRAGVIAGVRPSGRVLAH